MYMYLNFNQLLIKRVYLSPIIEKKFACLEFDVLIIY